MAKNLLLLTGLLILLFSNFGASEATAESFSTSSEVKVDAKQLDRRAQILRSYLAQFNSPLQDFAQDFVEAADKYNLSWHLVPAIAGVESTFGKFIPGGFNAWGWGVYGTQAIYFKSWTEGIYTVSQGLRENYFNKGLTDPYSINRIYAASPAWGWKVDYFMKEIAKFQNQYEKDNQYRLSESDIKTDFQIAGASAILASGK